MGVRFGGSGYVLARCAFRRLVFGLVFFGGFGVLLRLGGRILGLWTLGLRFRILALSGQEIQ